MVDGHKSPYLVLVFCITWIKLQKKNRSRKCILLLLPLVLLGPPVRALWGLWHCCRHLCHASAILEPPWRQRLGKEWLFFPQCTLLSGHQYVPNVLVSSFPSLLLNTTKTLAQQFFHQRHFFSYEKVSETSYTFGKERVLQRYSELTLSPAVPRSCLIWFSSHTWAINSQRGS